MEAQAGELLLEVLVEELVLLLECGMLLLHLPQKVQPLLEVTLQLQVISLFFIPHNYIPYYHYWPAILINIRINCSFEFGNVYSWHLEKLVHQSSMINEDRKSVV